MTTEDAGPEWALAAGLTAGVAVAVLFAGAGIVLARPDLALLALPLIVTAGWAWDRRPDRCAPSTLAATVEHRGDEPWLRFALNLDAPAGTESVLLRLTSLDGLPQEIAVTAETAADLHGDIPVLHSGPQEVLRIEYRLVGVDAAVRSQTAEPLKLRQVIPPPYTAITSLPLPRRLQGLTGTHDSARPGDGGEFRDIHSFTAGDRLRRIDWKATARRGRFAGDLYVRRTAATADATILVVLDSHDDVGEHITEWNRNRAAEKGLSSLDLAREAASSIAAGYIRAGDRVGFQDLATQHRMIAHGGGNRHLRHLLRAIELIEPTDVPTYRRRAPIVPPGALIYVLSAFLDDGAARMAGLWRSTGHRVIAVDVLPLPRYTRATRDEQIAHRVVMMERNDRLQALRTQGIEMLSWQDSGPSAERAAELLVLSRPSRGAR